MKKVPPYPFVLDELADLSPLTRPMFGAFGVYVNGAIVFALRNRETSLVDNGVWLATSREHHASLQSEFPNMRSIAVLGDGETGWQILAEDTEDFEEAVVRACEFIRRGDPRIGKIPKKKLRPGSKKAAKKSAKKKAVSRRK